MNIPSDDAKKRQERNLTLFGVLAVLFVFVGMAQSWNVSLAILNLCLISAIMTLGVNIQWGYAGIVNFGVMGFAALGGLAGVLVSMPPVYDGWQAGGMELLLGGLVIMLTIVLAIFIASRTKHLGRWRFWLIVGVSMCGYFLLRMLVDPAIAPSNPSIRPRPVILAGWACLFCYLGCWRYFCRRGSLCYW